MSNSTGRDGAQSQIMTVSTPGVWPDGWVERRFTRPRSAMDAQFHFAMSKRFTAPFVAAFENATARLLPIASHYAFQAIDRRLNSRQRRKLARALRRQIDATALRILATGK